MMDTTRNGTATHAVVSLEGVSKTFGDRTALEHIRLEVVNGEFLTLLGPSGCGKTTLLRCIAGFEEPTSGTLSVAGRDMRGVPPEKRAVNTVFQSYALFPHMNVWRNVAFGLEVKGMSRATVEERVNEALELVRMADFAERMPSALSGGQQQRVAIARALVNRPLVLLLDEPLSALDSRLRQAMRLELKHLQRQLGITFILVTHDQEEAFALSDRVAVLNNGRIEQVGEPREIYEEPANLFVANFVGETNLFEGTVVEVGETRLRVDIEGRGFTVRSMPGAAVGHKVHIILRPEDMRVETLKDLAEEPELYDDFPEQGSLRGRIVETIYKGTTYDVILVLESGHRIMVTEFFNEDAEDVYFQPGDEVLVSWVEGWEVVLPYGD